MKTHTKLMLFFLLILLPSFSIGQSISENLKYINDQFSLYNAYETSFRVDKSTKEMICEDKFGILKANWSDIEITASENFIGIYCLNMDSECIRYYDKYGTRNYEKGKGSYTMGLNENDKIISNIDIVLEKFAEIKRIITNKNHTSLGSHNSDVERQINVELNTVNQIFQRSSEYKNVYTIDFSKKTITATTKSCRAIVPVKSGLSVNNYQRNGDYGYGFYFENSDKSILESCTSFEDYTEKTHEYLSNYEDAQTVIHSLKNIINLLQSNSHSTVVGNTSVDELLRYINKQFRNYNAYNTVYDIDISSKQLTWKNDFGANYVKFKNLEVRADYENSWIGIYCLSGDECISQKTTSGDAAYYSKYTMSLNEDGKMISHINEVVSSFSELKAQILNGSKPINNNNFSDNDDPDSPDK